MSQTPSPRLNLRQQKFVDAYLLSGNATQAAIAAGYSKKAAGADGPRLLKSPTVKAAIDAAKDEATEAAGAEAKRVVQELAERVFFDPVVCVNSKSKLLDLRKMPPEARRQIASFDLSDGGITKLRFWSKDKAIELLGKYHRLFTEQVEIAGRDGTPVQVTIDLGAAREEKRGGAR